MEKPPTIRDLCPHFTESQLAEAEDAIQRYLALVLQIFDRIQADPLTETNGTLRS